MLCRATRHQQRQPGAADAKRRYHLLLSATWRPRAGDNLEVDRQHRKADDSARTARTGTGAITPPSTSSVAPLPDRREHPE
jgi:hypothetical protein